MALHSTIILIAILGALCLAMWAIARRWPGDGPWSDSGMGEGERKRAESRYVQVILARQVLLRALRTQFGEPPASVVARIENSSFEWCVELLARARTAGSLEELGLNAEYDDSPTAADAHRS